MTLEWDPPCPDKHFKEFFPYHLSTVFCFTGAACLGLLCDGKRLDTETAQSIIDIIYARPLEFPIRFVTRKGEYLGDIPHTYGGAMAHLGDLPHKEEGDPLIHYVYPDSVILELSTAENQPEAGVLHLIAVYGR